MGRTLKRQTKIRGYREILTLLSILFTVSLLGVSVEARDDAIQGSRYTSARGVAMGDAFVGLADDNAASALFYNPAGLAHIRKPQFELFNLTGQANPDFVKNFNSDTFKFLDLKGYKPRLQEISPAFPGLGGSLTPNLSMAGFGAAVHFSDERMAQYTGGSVRYRTKTQVIPAIGFGMRLASGIIRLGYSLQWVNKAQGDLTVVDDGTKTIGYRENLARGNAFSHNAGMTITLPYQYLPSFSGVARNIGGAKYKSKTPLMSMASNPSGSPGTEKMTLDGAIGYVSKAGRGSQFNYGFEYKDVTNRSRISVLGRVAAGMEFSFKSSAFLRLGWGSGYPTAGIGMNGRKADLSLSWFSDEIGTSYHDTRNQIFMLQVRARVF